MNFSALSSRSLIGVFILKIVERGARYIGLCRSGSGSDDGHFKEWSPRQANDQFSNGDE